MSDVDYQQAGAVRQALAEREVAEAQGNVEAVKAANKRLAAAGYVEEKPAKVKDEAPQGRSSRQAQQQKADEV